LQQLHFQVRQPLRFVGDSNFKRFKIDLRVSEFKPGRNGDIRRPRRSPSSALLEQRNHRFHAAEQFIKVERLH
jgi:hypothetical protein